MPRQRRVAWMCPSRSTCCHGCWVSPNTFSDPVFAHYRDAIRMCLSAPFGAIQQEHHTAYHTAVLLHTHVTRIVTPSPRRHTAIQRHTALYEHTAIQHHTAYTPYNTPQLGSARLHSAPSAPLGPLGFRSCAGSPLLFPQLTDLYYLVAPIAPKIAHNERCWPVCTPNLQNSSSLPAQPLEGALELRFAPALELAAHLRLRVAEGGSPLGPCP